MASTLGTIQPFRYRGYVWDEETGQYYLRSRYYNPVLHRFVNADVLLNGNLYEYCSSNPVVRSDPLGLDDVIHNFTNEINSVLFEAVKTFNTHFVQNTRGDSKNSLPTTIDILCSIDDYFWLMLQVNNGAAWDLKTDGAWKQQFPNIPMPANGKYFMFRGHKITREDLGNICYGYLGSSMGINSEILYACGGAVRILKEQNRDVSDLLNSISGFSELIDLIMSNLSNAPLYGDDLNDHVMIELGINLYYEDYSSGY